MFLGIMLLLLAAFEIESILLSGCAVLITMVANGALISFSTLDAPSTENYQQVPGASRPQALEWKTCVQGYAMLPITITSIVSLAMYKAAEDAESIGPGKANHTRSNFFLEYLGHGDLVKEVDSAHNTEKIAATFQTKFIQGVIFAGVAYMVILGCRACFMANHFQDPISSESDRERWLRSAARSAFGASIVLLVFAVVGFAPLALSSAAAGMALIANAALFVSNLERISPTSSPRTRLQAHAFTIVTLACLFCFTCVFWEQKALDGTSHLFSLDIHFIGFQQVFFAGSWFIGTLALREAFSAAEGMEPGRR